MSGMRVRCWIVLGLACVSAPTACTSPEAAVPRNVVRDSAGIRIVESASTERYPAPWLLETVPDWQVGEVDGEPHQLFDRIAGAVQLADGNLLVADGGSNQLRFFRPDGTFIRSEGREGEGPGEFQYIRGLGHCRADGFVAFDLNWQMNAYAPDGTFLEKTTMRVPSGVTPYELACDRHGHVVMIGWGQALAEERPVGYYAAYDRLLLTDLDGAIERDFGEHLASERIGSRFGSRPHPAGRATRFALHEDLLYVGSGEAFEVQVRTLSDSLVALLRGPRLPLELTDDLRSAYLDQRLAEASEESRPDLRREIEGWSWPPSLPAFTELRVDARGVVWLLAFSLLEDTPQTWALIDPTAGYLGDLTLPARHELLSIGPDHLLARTTDELEVERVVRLQLTRRKAR